MPNSGSSRESYSQFPPYATLPTPHHNTESNQANPSHKTKPFYHPVPSVLPKAVPGQFPVSLCCVPLPSGAVRHPLLASHPNHHQRSGGRGESLQKIMHSCPGGRCLRWSGRQVEQKREVWFYRLFVVRSWLPVALDSDCAPGQAPPPGNMERTKMKPLLGARPAESIRPSWREGKAP